ncbi:MAG: AbrB/MazE/SpoVT family DNA-binding domain-containing protein [Halobacteriota archaeon]
MASNSDSPGVMLPPAMLFRGWQEAGEQAVEQHLQMMRSMFAMPMVNEYQRLGDLGKEIGMFKTRVQSGGRISIPDAEREALGLSDGDIVQTFVVPIKRSRGED